MDRAPTIVDLCGLIERQPAALIPLAGLHLLDLGAVAPQEHRLLYAVQHEGRLLYLGKSKDLRLRLGYLVGGLASGDERLHAGGARLREMGLEPRGLDVAVFPGDGLYRRHYHLVRELLPPANREARLREGQRLRPSRNEAENTRS